MRETLKELNITPSKQRGQNFLLRPDILAQIVTFGDAPAEAHVVEIGPGTGALTHHLSWASQLTLIEVEPRLCEHLRQQFPQAHVINRDFRSVDVSALGSGLFVFGNIPYIFSTDIIFHLIAHRAAVRCAVLMTQREFAERLAAPPGGRTYGSISVAVQLWAEVELGTIVPGSAFHPPTQVESQLVKLTFRQRPLVDVPDDHQFEQVVRAAFAQRRKKMSNSLLARGMWSREVIRAALDAAQLHPDIRPEQVSIEQFAALATQLAAAPRG